jgi:hypothetical protein
MSRSRTRISISRCGELVRARCPRMRSPLVRRLVPAACWPKPVEPSRRRVARSPLVGAGRVAAWQVWQIEHTAGGIQEGREKRALAAGTVQKVGDWLSRDVRRAFVPSISGSIAQRLRRDRGWIMNNVLSLQLSREGARQPRGRSHGHALSMRNGEMTQLDGPSTRSQRLFERLEAENAQLRDSLVDLMLQIQALRDGARA